MRKIKLELDQLEVASFETGADSFAAGTVAAHLNEAASGPHLTCDPIIETCAVTCYDGHSCDQTRQNCVGSYLTDCALCLIA